jgi:hypothetical protein
MNLSARVQRIALALLIPALLLGAIGGMFWNFKKWRGEK